MIVFCERKMASWWFFESLATIVVFFFLQFSLLAPGPLMHFLDGATRHGLLDKLLEDPNFSLCGRRGGLCGTLQGEH
jgi:hypothetical protein